MLAEPRRKKKICLPVWGNSKPFYDENSLGLKMLQKMGWQEGSGLGKDLQGMKAPLRPKCKFDMKGISTKDEARDYGLHGEGVDHQATFNDLLVQLNAENQNSTKDTRSLSSLEERSKKAKRHIHYYKYARGKDVSKYSLKDFEGIMGKKATRENLQFLKKTFDHADETGDHVSTQNEELQENSVDLPQKAIKISCNNNEDNADIRLHEVKDERKRRKRRLENKICFSSNGNIEYNDNNEMLQLSVEQNLLVESCRNYSGVSDGILSVAELPKLKRKKKKHSHKHDIKDSLHESGFSKNENCGDNVDKHLYNYDELRSGNNADFVEEVTAVTELLKSKKKKKKRSPQHEVNGSVDKSSLSGDKEDCGDTKLLISSESNLHGADSKMITNFSETKKKRSKKLDTTQESTLSHAFLDIASKQDDIKVTKDTGELENSEYVKEDIQLKKKKKRKGIVEIETTMQNPILEQTEIVSHKSNVLDNEANLSPGFHEAKSQINCPESNKSRIHHKKVVTLKLDMEEEISDIKDISETVALGTVLKQKKKKREKSFVDVKSDTYTCDTTSTNNSEHPLLPCKKKKKKKNRTSILHENDGISFGECVTDAERRKNKISSGDEISPELCKEQCGNKLETINLCETKSNNDIFDSICSGFVGAELQNIRGYGNF